MAPIDEKSDSPGSGDNSTMGQGKDVLFGWLVGRAAADLGLAQALAVTEAQRNDQLRRLEQSLIAQIQDLRKQQGLGDTTSFDQIKNEIEAFTNRVGSLETANEQAGQIHRSLQNEIQTLQQQLNNSSLHAALDPAAVEDIQNRLTEQIVALEAKLNASEKREASNSAMELQFANLNERLARVEHLAGHADIRPAPAPEAINETLGALVQQALQPLHTRLNELEHKPSMVGQDLGQAVAAVQGKLAELETKVAAGPVSPENGERFDQMQAQLQNLTERINQLNNMPSVAEALAAREAEHVRAMKQVEESFAAKLGSMDRELNKKIDQSSASREDSARWRNELDLLRDSFARVEAARQGAQREATLDMQLLSQSIEQLMSEVASLKEHIPSPSDQQDQIDGVLGGLERRWVSNFQELRAELASVTQAKSERDASLNQLHHDLQMLDRRLAHAESSSQQSQALATHVAQFEQTMNALRGELSRVQEQLDERQKREVLARGVADHLGVKIRELQSLVDGKLLDDHQRDAEIEQLRGEIKTLSLGAKSGTVGVHPIATVAARVSAGGGYVSEPAMEPERTSELRTPHLGDPFAEDRTTTSTIELDKPVLSDRERSRLLQDRMSADIERVRAELREKSGRWKVRR